MKMEDYATEERQAFIKETSLAQRGAELFKDDPAIAAKWAKAVTYLRARGKSVNDGAPAPWGLPDKATEIARRA